MTLPEVFKIVEAIEPKSDAAGSTGAYVSLKNAHYCWVVLHITQGNAATIEVGINESPIVSGAGSQPATALFDIWSNLDCAASDTLVKRTSAAVYETNDAIKHKQVIIGIDPTKLTATFDCIAVTTAASDVDNLVEAQYYLQSRYPQGTPPSAIVD